MKILRNREMRQELILHILAMALLFAAAAFTSLSSYALLLIAAAVYSGIHLLCSRLRYRAIARLSAALNRILHGQEQLLMMDNAEGELAILSSEIQKMTLRLKESSDALRADKVQLTEAIADISHQLRTPLTSMNLTVSLLSAEDLSQEHRLSLTRDLRKCLRRIDWLIEALLKISKIDAGTARFKAEKVSVRELADKAVGPLAITMELKEQTLLCSISEESFTGDMAWCTEALGNILKNCVEHTPAGGQIEIAAEETALYTEIIVRDNGAGFDPADLPHLFERFYKGRHASAESIGIGLALSRMVVAAQNGTLQASNRKTGGAQFVIRFYKGII